MLQQISAVFLVLGLLLAALWLLRRQGLASLNFTPVKRRAGRNNSARILQVCERLALTPHHSLHLVSIGNKLVLFATSPTGCQTVDVQTFIASQDLEQGPALKTGASC